MKTKKSVELPWHPNFRDLSALPDIKVVRSVFFVNFVALTATLILTGIWLFVELQIATLTDLNKGNENQINFMGKNNKTLLAQSAEFEKMAKEVEP